MRNRTLHCGITAPLLLVAGAVFLLSDMTIVDVQRRFVWTVVGAGIGIAFLLEMKYARSV
jgi:hypothetical protein